MERVSLIKFPGILRDPSDTTGLVAALGGEDAIRSATFLGDGENPGASLTCQLRPGELSSRSNIGSVVTSTKNSETSIFVLHVTGDPEPGDADTTAASPSTAKSLVAVIDSQVEKVFSFPGIADFQLFSQQAIADVEPSLRCESSDVGSLWMHGGLRPSGAKSVPVVEAAAGFSASGAIPWREKSRAEALAESAWEFSKDARKHLDGDEASDVAREMADRGKWLSDMRPSRWARSITDEGATDPWFKDFAMNAYDDTLPAASEEDGTWREWTPEKASLMLGVDATPVKVDGRSSSARITSLAYRVDVCLENVPTESPFQAEPTFINARKAIDVLRERFASRPVWSRRKLLSTACENTRRHFKNAVPHVAYAFTALTGPFQSLWIRYGYDPRKGMVENLRWQAIELRLPDARSTAAIEKKFGTALARDDIDDVGNHSLAEMPSKRQLSLQLCDIVAPGLEALLKEPTHVRKEFDTVTGYLTQAGLRAVLSHLRSRVQTLVIETLGEANFQSLVEMQTEKEKSRKRARYNSNWNLIRKETLEVVSPSVGFGDVPSQTPGTADAVTAIEDSYLVAEKLAAELQAAGIDAVDEEGPIEGDDAVVMIATEEAHDRAIHEGNIAESVVDRQPCILGVEDADMVGTGSDSVLTRKENDTGNRGSDVIDRVGLSEKRTEVDADENNRQGTDRQAGCLEEAPVETDAGGTASLALHPKVLSERDDAESASCGKAPAPEAGEPSAGESDVEGFQIYDDDVDMEDDAGYDDDDDDDG